MMVRNAVSSRVSARRTSAASSEGTPTCGAGADLMANLLAAELDAFQGKRTRAGKTHVFQSLPQSLTASMKPHRYIVQRGAEACGDSLPRLAQDIGAPDDIGVVCLERRQQLIEAVAYYLVDLRVGRDCLTCEFEILLFHQNLPAPKPDRAALVIGDCRRQDPAKPSPDWMDVAQIRRALDGPNREA